VLNPLQFGVGDDPALVLPAAAALLRGADAAAAAPLANGVLGLAEELRDLSRRAPVLDGSPLHEEGQLRTHLVQTSEHRLEGFLKVIHGCGPFWRSVTMNRR
jgi:hypothetical protein